MSAAVGVEAATTATPAGPSVLQAAADLAGDAGRVGSAWFELARAELAVARTSAVRLAAGIAVSLVLAFATWLFACLALGYWLAGLLARPDLAMLIVAGVNIAIIAGMAVAMRTWWRRMHMPESRAALGDIARSLS
jgi:hypothetical protein